MKMTRTESEKQRKRIEGKRNRQQTKIISPHNRLGCVFFFVYTLCVCAHEYLHSYVYGKDEQSAQCAEIISLQ